MRKEIKIKIMGTAGSGKSLVAHIIQQALSDCGIHGTLIDDEFPRERNLSENIIARIGGDFDVEIETIQLNRKCI